MVEDSRRGTVNTEPSAVAPDARVYFGNRGLTNRLNTEGDHSIRRYCARLCNGGRVFPQLDSGIRSSVAAALIEPSAVAPDPGVYFGYESNKKAQHPSCLQHPALPRSVLYSLCCLFNESSRERLSKTATALIIEIHRIRKAGLAPLFCFW
jgi:hypothetical protein